MSTRVDQFVFGYGSLLLPSSRAQTIGKHGRAVPVKVSGVLREWSAPAPEYGLTAVSLRDERGSVCNGVVFPVNAEQLARLDKREAGYTRTPLEHGEITHLQPDEPIPPSATVWKYVATTPGVPTPVCPIAQSYLDVILTGCIEEFGEDFARDFIATTAGWNANWVNDRAHPRYPSSTVFMG